jgi:GAF domain-containing protein
VPTNQVSRHPQAVMRDAFLQDLVQIVEGRVGRAFIASVLVLEGQELRHAAAPGLPACYKQAVNGLRIGPHVGSCGTAAFRGHPIYVSDISTDPLWAPYSNIARMALDAGLRSCWSVPIVSGGRVLGTFGLYHREPRDPTVAERDLIAEATRPAVVLFGHSSAVPPSSSAAGILSI